MTTGTHELSVTCSDPSNLANSNPDYVLTVSAMLRNIGAKKVNCGSCYRDKEEQRRACRRICGRDSCPSLCAAPGRSQHQKKWIAVCDLSGLGANGCYKLKQLCDQKFGGKCGIGGYRSGGYHFGVGDNHFSRWNRCAGLSRAPGNYPPDKTPPATGPTPPADPNIPDVKDNADYSALPPADPSPGSNTGSELDAQNLNKEHIILIAAAMALVGAGAAALYFKSKGK